MDGHKLLNYLLTHEVSHSDKIMTITWNWFNRNIPMTLEDVPKDYKILLPKSLGYLPNMLFLKNFNISLIKASARKNQEVLHVFNNDKQTRLLRQ
jgi:hypothetical protein